jgi:hypothetical protein
MAGDDPTPTLEQARADALVDLILTNVEVATTIPLMIPVQTITVDEPDGSLERDLIVRADHTPAQSNTPVTASTPATGTPPRPSRPQPGRRCAS